MIGRTISHYRIIEKLGEGGMGVVYKAQDTKLDRLVALKFLPPNLSASDQDKERFIQEAKAAAALNHPNICTIHEIDEHESQLFIAMELIEGQMLRDKGPNIPLKQAIEIGIQVADGLAAAHEKGIVHRDLKPENIMLQKDGRVKIMDFGLAKLKGASRLTKVGITVGTAGYMSPEQVQGVETDHRTDIFSLGVILYEVFAGQSPFKGVHETAINYEIVNVDPSPMSMIKSDVQPEIDEIVLNCLAKDVTDRLQSAAEVVRLLRRLRKESSKTRVGISRQSDVPSSVQQDILARVPKKERWLWGGISIGLAVMLAIIASLYFSQEETHPMTIRFMMTVEENATVSSMALSKDGTKLVYASTGLSKTLLWVRRIDELTSRSIAGTEGASNPFWSPDGRFVAFFSAGKLKKIDISGGAPIAICDAPNNRGGSWNQFGEIIFAPNAADVIYKVSAAGGTPEPIMALDTSVHETQHLWPFFLPDGKRFLYSSRRYDHDNQRIYIGSLTRPPIRTTVSSGGNPLFSPPGYLLFLNNRTLVAQRLDVETGVLSGDPSPVAENVGHVPLTGLSAFTVSANGVLATGGGRSEERQYAWFDRKGSNLGTAGPSGNYFDIALSPDESRAALQFGDLRTANSDIFLIDIRRNSLTRFTFSPNVDDDPIWSPDGSRILFTSIGPLGVPQAFSKQSSGTGEEEALPIVGRVSDWSRDGKYILFNYQIGGDIYYLPTAKGEQPKPYLNSPAYELYGQFSPNGKYIAYSSNETGNYEVYVQAFPGAGGKRQISRGGGSQPRWRKDGKELFYVAPDRTLMAVQVSFENGFEYGDSTPLFRTQVDDYDAPNRYVVSNDGQRFLINVPMGRASTNPVAVVVNWPAELTKK